MTMHTLYARALKLHEEAERLERDIRDLSRDPKTRWSMVRAEVYTETARTGLWLATCTLEVAMKRGVS